MSSSPLGLSFISFLFTFRLSAMRALAAVELTVFIREKQKDFRPRMDFSTLTTGRSFKSIVRDGISLSVKDDAGKAECSFEVG